MGAIVGNVVNFGAAVQRPSATQAASAARYSSAHAQSLSEFLFNMVPENLFGAFVHDNVLQVLVIALLVGAAMVRMGETGVTIRRGMERCIGLVFGVVNIIVMAAPIGAFGALGFTVGRFGVRTLYALGLFVGTAWAYACACLCLSSSAWYADSAASAFSTSWDASSKSCWW